MKTYVPHMPKLEWLVVLASPRMFNAYFDPNLIERYTESGGLGYDKKMLKDSSVPKVLS